MMTIGGLGRFFYERDLPEAMKFVGTLRLAGSMIVASYTEKGGRWYSWRERPLIVYRFMGVNNILIPHGDDRMLSDDLIHRLCTTHARDRDAITELQKRLKLEWGRTCNKRETIELMESFRRNMEKPQEVTEERIRSALDLWFDRRYRLEDIDEALAERRRELVAA